MGSISYAQYCARRGYTAPYRGWSVIRRSLLESWAQPGFHRFWRVWNPPVGYPLYRFYVAMGGNRNRMAAIFVVFAVAGVPHDLVVRAFNPSWGPVITTAYCAFALLSLLSLRLAGSLKQYRWPTFANIITDVGLVAITVETSRRLYQR